MSFFYCFPSGQICIALMLSEALPLTLGDLYFIATCGLVHEFRLHNSRFCAFSLGGFVFILKGIS